MWKKSTLYLNEKQIFCSQSQRQQFNKREKGTRVHNTSMDEKYVSHLAGITISKQIEVKNNDKECLKNLYNFEDLR